MKAYWMILPALLAMTSEVAAQVPGDGALPVDWIKKGTITLKSGSVDFFRDLKSTGDSVYYFDTNMTYTKAAMTAIARLNRQGSYTGVGALSGGLLGLLGGGIVAGLAEAGGALITVFSFGTVEPEKPDYGPVFIVSTLIGTGLGILVGSLIKKDVNVYPGRNASVSFTPSVINENEIKGMALTCRIHIR